MNDHPNKHIRDAIDHALSLNWRLVKSGSHAHAWGRLYCAARARGGCIITVYGTPRVPENHARYIYVVEWTPVRIEPVMERKKATCENL